MPPTSGQCLKAEHDTCGHRPLGIQGENTGIKGRRWEITVVLCACMCHADCAMAAAESVPESEWAERCSCPGVAAEVQRRAARQRDRAERRDEIRAVLAEARPDPGAPRETIRANLVRALEERDMTWTPERIDATIVTLTAGAGHKALAVPRIVAGLALARWKRKQARDSMRE